MRVFNLRLELVWVFGDNDAGVSACGGDWEDKRALGFDVFMNDLRLHEFAWLLSMVLTLDDAVDEEDAGGERNWLIKSICDKVDTVVDGVDKNELAFDSNRFLLLASSFMDETCKVAAGCKVAYEVVEFEGVDEGLVVDADAVVVLVVVVVADADVGTSAPLGISLSSKPFM